MKPIILIAILTLSIQARSGAAQTDLPDLRCDMSGKFTQWRMDDIEPQLGGSGGVSDGELIIVNGRLAVSLLGTTPDDAGPLAALGAFAFAANKKLLQFRNGLYAKGLVVSFDPGWMSVHSFECEPHEGAAGHHQ